MAAENTVENTAGKQKMTRMEKSWILYDVGNSAFTLLASAVLPIYFNYLAGEGGVGETDATAYWGYAASIVTLIAAVSPAAASFFACVFILFSSILVIYAHR